jgi:pimeloyl-ACP methyl ester carboxylesterase
MSMIDSGPAPLQHETRHTQRPSHNDLREMLLAGLPISERRLNLADISTAVLEGGSGRPMVLLHGPGEHAAKWLRIIPELVKSNRVVAPDLPGHGTSDPINGVIDVARILDWLVELIAQTCEMPPILLGQIIGGAIAARFAAAYSDRLHSLVLSDALGLASFEPAPEFGAALGAFVAEPSPENHDRLWQRCAFDLDALRDHMGESWQHLRAYNLDRARAAVLKATQHGLMEQFGFPAIPQHELARISVSTHLIWGRQDLASPLSIAEAASARYGWPLVVIDNCGDDPAIEQPRAFVEALRTALVETGVDRECSGVGDE